MTTITRLAALLGFVALLAASLATARASEWDQKTILTIKESIQVADQVLPPGTYVFKLLNVPPDRHLVQIFNSEETKLVTATMTFPNYRLSPTGKGRFLFWETPVGQPKALRAWFYPGDNIGNEFADRAGHRREKAGD